MLPIGGTHNSYMQMDKILSCEYGHLQSLQAIIKHTDATVIINENYSSFVYSWHI